MVPLKSNSELGGKASDEICNMSEPVVEVQVRAVVEVSGGCAVFLGNEDKVFVCSSIRAWDGDHDVHARHA